MAPQPHPPGSGERSRGAMHDHDDRQSLGGERARAVRGALSVAVRRTAVGNARARGGAQKSGSAWRAKPQPLSSRSEEHTSELQSLMRISYAVFCLKKKKIYYH